MEISEHVLCESEALVEFRSIFFGKHFVAQKEIRLIHPDDIMRFAEITGYKDDMYQQTYDHPGKQDQIKLIFLADTTKVMSIK